MAITLYEFMEDFDNPELQGYDWEERLREAIDEYNEEHGTEYKPGQALRNYQTWKREKYQPEY